MPATILGSRPFSSANEPAAFTPITAAEKVPNWNAVSITLSIMAEACIEAFVPLWILIPIFLIIEISTVEIYKEQIVASNLALERLVSDFKVSIILNTIPANENITITFIIAAIIAPITPEPMFLVTPKTINPITTVAKSPTRI